MELPEQQPERKGGLRMSPLISVMDTIMGSARPVWFIVWGEKNKSRTMLPIADW